MTEDATSASLAALTDALAHMQEQLDQVSRTNSRVLATQGGILRRLETIGAGQAAIAELAARAHAASLGNGTTLPADVADDPLLEHYLLTQPADRTSTARALVEWRKAATDAGSAELAELLADQYRPSPTDTPETRLLRFQLAAIAREELRGRGVTPPASPSSTRAEDRSPEAARRRSAELARLWRAGESAALFGEPELAGALDLFEAAERRRRGIPEEQLSAELAELHRFLGDRLAAGERPSAADERISSRSEPLTEIEPERPR